MHGTRLSAQLRLPTAVQEREPLVNAAIGGWMISGTMFYRTGFPFSIIDGGAIARRAQPGRTSSSAQRSCCSRAGIHAEELRPTGRACALVSCLAIRRTLQPARTLSGTVGRNAFRGPGFLGGDMSIRKNFASHRAHDFPARLERVQLAQPCELRHALSEHQRAASLG